MQQPPVGEVNFRKLIEYRDSNGNPYLFVDKTLLIKDILDDASIVKLITRPRRFGKTLNMSMLHHFFANTVEGQPTAHLFNHLKISGYPNYISRYQGKFPVINLSFKNVKANHFEDAYEELKRVIRTAYEENTEILSSNKITHREKTRFESLLDNKATDSDVKASLKDLTFYLNRFYGVKPIILIDEYDTPIQAAYLGNYYKEMIAFMKGLLGEALKDNPYLENAILTGVLRVSKESIFSDLNNITSYSLLNARYSEYFGFKEQEIQALLRSTHLEQNFEDVTTWYNGYRFGDSILYNPWSIVNYIKEKGRLNHYWVNTSDNLLIKNLIIRSSIPVKNQLQTLLSGNLLERTIDENIIYDQLESSDSALWTLLVMSGYLKIKSIKTRDPFILYELDIPNREVKDLYRKMITEWLSGVNDPTVFNIFLTELLEGNLDNFEKNLKKLMLQTFSSHDIKGKEPEKFFHGFMLGLVAVLDPNQYQIHSNKESGKGRFDIAIIPNDTSKFGIIIEIKNTENTDPNKLKMLAEEALQQINQNEYQALLSQNQTHKILEIGVAFCGKNLVIEHRIV